jgi:hypothetical protein
MAVSINNKQPLLSAIRMTCATRASQLLAKERRTVIKASKCTSPSRELQLTILKHIAYSVYEKLADAGNASCGLAGRIWKRKGKKRQNKE